MDGFEHFISEVSWWLSLIGLINIFALLYLQFIDRTKQKRQHFFQITLYTISGYFILSLFFGTNLEALPISIVILSTLITSVLFFMTYWVGYCGLREFIYRYRKAIAADIEKNHKQVTPKNINLNNILSNEEINFLQQVIS